jgi:hypothetical protein
MEFFAIETSSTNKVIKIIAKSPQEATTLARNFFNNVAVHVNPKNEWSNKPFATIKQQGE